MVDIIEENKKEIKEKKTLEDKNPFLIKGRGGGYYPNEDLLARHLIIKYDFKTIYGKKYDELYICDNGIYRTEKAREIIKTECETLLLKYCKNKNVLEVTEKIKRLTATNRDIFDNIPKNLIPLKNGIFDLNEKKLINYNKKYPFTFVIPVEFNKEADCPLFLKFLEETLYPEDIPVVQEWFGFNLYREYFIKKGIIFIGVKDTGKSVLLLVLIHFLGQENITAINLQRITNEDKFALSNLYNKLANIYDDLSSKDINNGGGFKIATGNGFISGEYKFGDTFQFRNFAKMLFACNKVPVLKDDDDNAYLFRWLPIEFLNVIPEDEQDKFLIDKLTTQKELSGILNWSLEGLDRILQNGKFSYNKSESEIQRIMKSGDNLKKFGEDCLRESNGKKISKESMYQLYTFWAKETSASRFSKNQLGRRLEESLKYIIAKRDTNRFWENVELNPNGNFFMKLKESIKVDKHKLDGLDTFKKTNDKISIKDEDNDFIDSLYMIFPELSNPSNINPPVVICSNCNSTDIHEYTDVIFCNNCKHRRPKKGL